MAGRIVVGVDGSPQSGKALEWAVARASLGGEELELISAYAPTPVFDFYGFNTLPETQAIEWYAEASRQVLDAAAARVRELNPELTCTLKSELGHAAHLLADASAGAVAVVVGRRGLGAAASVVLGSVSNKLTIQAKCPVVVVGDGDVPASGPIVVGVDGSDFSGHALRYALAEAELRKTTVRAVAAYDFMHPALQADPELLERLQADFEAEIEDAITAVLQEAGGQETAVDVERVAVAGRPAEAILDHASDAQLIVVGTHGRGLVRRVLLGSVSRRVLNDADRPVAVVDLPAS